MDDTSLLTQLTTLSRLRRAGSVDALPLDDMLESADRLDRELLESSLYEFVKAAWHVIEPGKKFVDGRHIAAVCEHIERSDRGELPRLIINEPPRMTKPVACDAYVLTRRGFIVLGNVVIGDEVWTHKNRWRRVLAIREQGVLPVLNVTTKTGRTVNATADHLFLTPDGWQQLGMIGPDDVVGIAPCRDEAGDSTISLTDARLLGYLVGDGSCRGTANITCADEAVAIDIRHCILAKSWTPTDHVYRMTKRGTSLWRITLTAPNQRRTGRKGYRGPVRSWLESHGLWNKTSYTKMIPDAVMRGSNDIVRAFLGAYWSCDGCVSVKGAKRDGVERDDLEIRCDSVNRQFLKQIQLLLTRLGISSAIYSKTIPKKTQKQGTTYTSYCCRLNNQDAVWRFARLISFVHRRADRIAKARLRRFAFDHDIWGDIVRCVEGDGHKQCRCLSVDEDQSFTADGFIVHNSTVSSVCYPAWKWTTDPSLQFLCVSHSDRLASDLSQKSRRLITSDWYQSLWRTPFLRDQDQKLRFDNDYNGSRFAVTLMSKTQGVNADKIILDDAMDRLDVVSEARRRECRSAFSENIATRLNDPKTGTILAVGHRLGMDDLYDYLLKSGYDVLTLPMRYESNHPTPSSTGFVDWRTVEGELLCPARFSEAEAEATEKRDPYLWAGQYEQRPRARGGVLFKEEFFSDAIVRMSPAKARRVRYWDVAASIDPSACYTVGIKMSESAGTYYVEHMVRRQVGTDARRRMMRVVAAMDAKRDPACEQTIEAQGGSAGKDAGLDDARNLAGCIVHTRRPPTGNKLVRAEAVASQFEAGNIKIVQGDWNQEFIQELLGVAAGGARMDVSDSIAGAFFELRNEEISLEAALSQFCVTDDEQIRKPFSAEEVEQLPDYLRELVEGHSDLAKTTRFSRRGRYGDEF